MERLRKKEDTTKSVPHFSLAPRLQRMFSTKEALEEAQWHKLKREANEKEMSQPADGGTWKDFVYPYFEKDPRNLRLGLATDGFNLFSEQDSRYSTWHVFVVPYNLLP